MKLRISSFFILISVFMNAQTPGYMGKHCMIGYTNNFSPALLMANAKSVDPPGINSSHCFNLDYVIKNRTSFCVSYQFMKTGMNFDNNIDIEDAATSYNLSYEPKSKLPMQLKSNNITLGFKFFKRGNFAPVGKYKKLDLMLMFSTVSYEQNAFTYHDYNSSTQVRRNYGKGEYNFSTFAIAYTLGRQRVFFNCLVLDYGVQFAATPAGLLGSVLGDNSYYVENGSELEAAIKHQKNVRLVGHQLVNIHLGLGFLAF